MKNYTWLGRTRTRVLRYSRNTKLGEIKLNFAKWSSQNFAKFAKFCRKRNFVKLENIAKLFTNFKKFIVLWFSRNLSNQDIGTLKRPVMHLDVSTAQGPKLHLDLPRLVWTTWACATLRCFTSQGPELHLDMSTPQGPELHMDLFGQHEPMLLLNFLHHRGLSCTWTCLH